MEVRTLSLSGDLTNETVGISYPHLRISNATDATVVVLTGLPEGDLGVLMDVNGQLRQLRAIEMSVSNIHWMSKVCDVVLYVSAEKHRAIHSAIDIMEALV